MFLPVVSSLSHDFNFIPSPGSPSATIHTNTLCTPAVPTSSSSSSALYFPNSQPFLRHIFQRLPLSPTLYCAFGKGGLQCIHESLRRWCLLQLLLMSPLLQLPRLQHPRCPRHPAESLVQRTSDENDCGEISSETGSTFIHPSQT